MQPPCSFRVCRVFAFALNARSELTSTRKSILNHFLHYLCWTKNGFIRLATSPPSPPLVLGGIARGALLRRHFEQLGCVDDMTKKEARSEAKVFLAKINQLLLHLKPQSRSPRSSSQFTFLTRSNGCGRRRIAGTNCYAARSSHSVRGSRREAPGPATYRRS
jgi:hypothetical protein